MALAFTPRAGLSVISDDAYLLVRLGAAETFVRADADGTTSPLLATDWTQTSPTTWRFTLRDGVTFHDGTPLDASAAVTALTAAATAATPPRSLKGVGLTATAVDSRTVEITTAKADPLVPLRLSSPSTAILAPAAYGATPPSAVKTGTGPFTLETYVNGERIDLRRNEAYWGAAPALDAVTAQIIADPAARTAALRAGDVDLVEGVPAPQVTAVREDPDLDVAIFDLPRTTTLYVNTTKAPLDRLEVRRALDLVIDRAALAATLLEGAAAPASGYVGPAMAWDPDRTATTPDVAKAKELLAAAGVNDLRLQLWTYPTRAELPELATAVQDMLRSAGITVEITVAEYATLEPKVLAGEHDLFLLSRSHVTDVPDVGAFLLSDHTCTGGYNLNRFCDPELDALLAPLATTADQAARTKIFVSAVTELGEQHAGLPLLHDRARIGLSRRVVGFTPDPLEQRLVTPTLRLAG